MHGSSSHQLVSTNSVHSIPVPYPVISHGCPGLGHKENINSAEADYKQLQISGLGETYGGTGLRDITSMPLT